MLYYDSMRYRLALHIFRRDLRIFDNTSLTYSLKNAEKVIPCFILDPDQIENNPYRSDYALQFMIDCLFDLNHQLKNRGGRLYLFYGHPHNIVEQLIKVLRIDLVSINRDYTPFSRRRDRLIESVCSKYRVDFLSHHDLLLTEPERILKQNFQPYTIFTHFFNKAKRIPVSKPQSNSYKNYYNKTIAFAKNFEFVRQITPKTNQNLYFRGGRTEALKLLSRIENLNNYHRERNFPSLNRTTLLSPHNKFGTVSIREVYHTILSFFNQNHELIRELYWRDFFTYLVYHFPNLLENPGNVKYNKLKWRHDKNQFEQWCQGKTGIPVVDAGMRQLNQTGYIPNRIRLITASFLVKDLFIDWRWGEKYFAQQLVDYDPAVNNGNWQWVASIGYDAQPYFRVFNPWRQQEKFDPDCVYVKQWLPELQLLTSHQIHNIAKLKVKNYPRPIVEHQFARQRAINQFRKI